MAHLSLYCVNLVLSVLSRDTERTLGTGLSPSQHKNLQSQLFCTKQFFLELSSQFVAYNNLIVRGVLYLSKG